MLVALTSSRILFFLSLSPQRCTRAFLFLHAGFRSLRCHRAGWGKEEFCLCGRAFRRASLSYFTLILSDSYAVCFIVRRAFLELLHQAFHWGRAGQPEWRGRSLVRPSSLLSCATLGCDLCRLFPRRGVFLMSQKRGLNRMHDPEERCQGEEWSYSFCCWVENGENTCLSAVFCSAVTCFSELLQGATFCCFSSLCFLWQLPECCIKTASGELRWHGDLPPR